MSISGRVIGWLGSDPSPARRRSARAELRVEDLEDRALLSVSGMSPPAMPAVLMGHHGDRAMPAAVNSDIQGTGFAIKSPRFYELYMGPKEPQFNAVATTGVLVNRGGGPG